MKLRKICTSVLAGCILVLGGCGALGGIDDLIVGTVKDSAQEAVEGVIESAIDQVFGDLITFDGGPMSFLGPLVGSGGGAPPDGNE